MYDVEIAMLKENSAALCQRKSTIQRAYGVGQKKLIELAIVALILDRIGSMLPKRH